MTLRVLVDSTADIPTSRARDMGITIVPLTVTFGNKTYEDGVDLDGPGFYRLLSSSSVLPTTSTPPPSAFQQAYQRMIAEGATGILSVHIASRLSGTFSAASTAAQLVTADTGVPIEVVDSTSVSGGFGLPAQLVAQDARNGASLAQMKARAESLCSRVHVYAALDTLEFLKRGGRIGAAKALFGTLLNVKPLLEVRDGQVLPLENVRTKSRAQQRLGELVAKLGDLEAVSVVASDEAVGEQLKRVASAVWNGPIEVSPLGPVVGTHAGPGAGGIVAITRG